MADVRVGQIWADNNRRCDSRTILIMSVDKLYAMVRSNTGRISKIRLDRFVPSYRLIEGSGTDG